MIIEDTLCYGILISDTEVTGRNTMKSRPNEKEGRS